ncbi:uncharacterized protein BDCG_02297 [Blastomyces dermatitidis ER-3]|uniref:C2H2-type domain-containing protein n=1 Tax=Ajellomyces dermatitidis (strain ER-3 / ATCC MYA-2586) TaxID=559297 RepID=A0ABP2ETK3_AJEDR|nr:uncharacterized protein BDCG_02297 [Blastomyces dermatitidis ER-3]EEQ87177.1 hypothetical protein BDCG_02297 [Blastomyces dermatitidis ER-3]
MGKKLTHEQRKQRAREAGFDPDKSKLSPEKVKKQLEPVTRQGYDNVWDVWTGYCDTHETRDIFDEQTKNHFIVYIGKITRGKNPKKDPRPKPSSIMQSWLRISFSSCDKMIGRGLRVSDDLNILVIHNRKSQPEFIIRLKRDAKEMSNKKIEHPKHPMQEDIESLSLYLNPVLESLAICLAQGLFRDFETADEIFKLNPSPDESYELFERAVGEPTQLKFKLSANCSDKGGTENGYSINERMKFGGHTDPRVFSGSYMSSTSSVDGVGSILGSASWRHQQSLPRLVSAAPSTAMASPTSKTAAGFRGRPEQKYNLLAQELDAWQMRLAKERKPGTAEDDNHVLLYHWTWQKSPVSDHPALKTNNGYCPVAECTIIVNEQSLKLKWRHIYQCLKKSLQKLHGFSSLCFICHQWFTDKTEFEQHCQDHLDCLETIPIQYNYLEVCGMLASPGYCPECLGDTAKSASDRLKPFLDPQSLKREMDRHYKLLIDDKPAACGSPHCDMLFDSILNLQHHYNDLHCIPIPKKCNNFKLEVNINQPDLSQVKDNTNSDLTFDITTAASFKRKTIDIDETETAEPKEKHHKCELVYNNRHEETSPLMSEISESQYTIHDSGYSSSSIRLGDGSEYDCEPADASIVVSSLSSHIEPRLFDHKIV